MNFSNIEKEVRATLGDSAKQKFSPSRVKSTIYKVLNRLNFKYRFNVTKAYLPVSKYQETVTFPSDFYRQVSLYWNNKPVEIIGHTDSKVDPSAETANQIAYLIYGDTPYREYTIQPRLSEPSIDWVILDEATTITTPDWDIVTRVIYRESIYYLLYNTSTIDFDNLPSYKVEGTSEEEVLTLKYIADFGVLGEDIVKIPASYFDYIVYKSASLLLSENNRQENIAKVSLLEQRASVELQDLNFEYSTSYVNGKNEMGYRSL